MKTAILCSGGDCAGMNPAIKRYIEYSFEIGHRPHLVSEGFDGLIDHQVREAEPRDASGIISRGGTAIRSSRCPRFHEERHRETARKNLRRRGIEGLIVLGGDGSFRGIEALCGQGDLKAVGIPATIDNDVAGSDYALGVDTALNVIRNCLDEIRDTASSFRRGFVVETMGNRCGYLAIVSSIASGAEVCLIPEIPYDLRAIATRLRREQEGGRDYAIGVVSEATGASRDLAQMFERDLGLSARVTVLGHIQRGGSPTVTDRLRAFEFVTRAIDLLAAPDKVGAQALIRRGSEYSSARIPLEGGPALQAILALGKRLSS